MLSDIPLIFNILHGILSVRYFWKILDADRLNMLQVTSLLDLLFDSPITSAWSGDELECFY